MYKVKRKNLILSCLVITFIMAAFSTVNFVSAEGETDYYTATLDLRGIELFADSETEPSSYFSRNLQMALHFSDGTTLGKNIKITFKGGFTYKAMLVNGYQVYKLTFLDTRVFEINETQYNYFQNYTLTNLHINIASSQPGRWDYIYKTFVDPYGGSNRELPLNLVTPKTVSAEPDPVQDLPIEEDEYESLAGGVQAAVNQNKVTMYYLKLPTNGKTFKISGTTGMSSVLGSGHDNKDTAYNLAWAMSPGTTFVWNVMEDAARLANNRYHTFIITYNNIVVGQAEAALLTTWNIECTTVGSGGLFSGWLAFTSKSDIEINIRSEYYNLFENADFSDCTVTLMFGGVGYKMSNDTGSPTYDFTGATLHTREVQPDYDPIEEEGQAPDNGGVPLNPRAPGDGNWWDNILDKIKGGLAGFVTVIIIIVAAVVIIRYVKPKQ